jgi:hypothetical protein
MTNGDYNPFMRPERLVNDRRQIRITLVGTAIAAVVIIAMILLAIK